MTTSNAAETPEYNEVDEELLVRRRKHRESEFITGLNLTAMMDVLTILLVYLIKIYADAPENLTLNDDLRPPVSSAPDNIVPAVSVTISTNAIVVDQKKVMTIKDGKVIADEPGQAYAPLARALTQRVEIIRELGKRGASPFDGNLMVIAHEDTPYDIVSSVLYQAGKAEFTNYRLVVRKN